MKIEVNQIHSNHAFEVDKTIENALKLDQRLDEIVSLELKSGNLITGVSIGWPEKESVVLSFNQHISANHLTGENVKYTFVNDVRYWVHEYSTTTRPAHLVIS